MNQFTRRRVLTLAAAAAGGATLFDVPRVLAGLARRTPGPYGDFPVGVQSYSLRKFNALEAIRHIQGMGLHYVEFYSKHLSPQATSEEIAALQKILQQAEIQVSAHGVNSFSANHAANRRVFEFARRAGIRNITANPAADSFDSLEKLVEEFQIRIAIHNHGPGHHYDKISDVVKAVDGRHKWIGACVDTGHFIRSKEDPLEAVRALKGRVFALHIKDEAKREKNSHNVVIGDGHLDVVGLFRTLKETAFPADGSVSLEYEANPDNPIDDMKQCLEVARRAIAQIA